MKTRFTAFPRNPFFLPLACAAGSYALGMAAPHAAAAPRAERPNVVFILADDLGWRDLGCYGNTIARTPRIDALAREGMRFTQAYAYPTCSPTRVSLMTGDYPSRHGMALHYNTHQRGWERLSPPASPHALSPQAMSLADLTASRGYVSTLIGKWHLGYGNAPQNLAKVVMPPGMGPKTPRVAFGFEKQPVMKAKGIGAGYEQRLKEFTEANPDKRLGEDTFRAVRFIEQNRERPFFCYLAYSVVHLPLQGRADLLLENRRRVIARNLNVSPQYVSTVEAMDESVGLVLDALRELKLDKNTIVIFASDNGGVIQDYDAGGPITTSNYPLRGQKASLWEGGVRVPWIVRWPGVVAPGGESEQPILCTDFFPTLAAMTGAALPAKYSGDGVSLVPLMRGETKALPPRALFWHMPSYTHIHSSPSSAVRDGDFKLIEFLQDDHVELYNLAEDPGENHDLAAAQPERAAALRKKLHQWRESVGAEMPTLNPNYDPEKAHIWTVRPARPWEPAPLAPLKK